MTAPDDKILNCPACGTTITGRKSVCPRCGRKLYKSAKFECPSCGELIRKGSKVCPVCKVDLSGASTRTRPQSVKKTTGAKSQSIKKKTTKAKSQAVKKKTADQHVADLIETESTQARQEDQRPGCPKCGWILAGTESRCPKCGTPLDKIVEVAKPEIPLDAESLNKSLDKVNVEEPVHTRPCPFCGAFISENLQKCPLCNTSFVETKPREDPAAPDAELSRVQRSEDSAPAPVKVVAQAVSPTRKRMLKAAKATTVPATTQTSARGRTNRVRQVKVSGKVRSTDAVTGGGFVNGTGISNGLGAPSKKGSTKRTSFLTRWQFLAVLVVLVIVIPTFVFLSYSNKSSKFSIDGDFSDWNGATTYGTKIQSTSSTSNITEWAIGIQSPDLFFYLKTQAHMMSSPNAENFYLFVDSDGSKTTGYTMESIGADYLLQLTGWDSSIRSTSLARYTSPSDQYNWSAWTSIGSLSCSLDLARLEGRATMPVALEQSAKFMLVSKDSADRGSVSYTAPLKGGILIVEQVPPAQVTANGVLPKSASVMMLTVRFTCQGEGGRVDKVNSTIVGAPLGYQEPAFSIDKGEKHEMVIAVDTSTALDGQLVSAEVLASGIVSSFASVEIVGSGARAYVGSPPPAIAIDGAFADWAGRLSVDDDSIPVTDPSTDIDEVGNVSTAHDSYFYVSVAGDICSGTFVPSMVTKPSGGGGGGAVIQPRHTAEDILRIYVDSDKSNSTGETVALNSKQIGADQLIEVKGIFGRITSMKEFDYSPSSKWIEMTDVVQAAKDTKRIEISVNAVSIGGSADIDFIVETTSWKGRSDLATYDPSSMRLLTRTWIVDPGSTSPYATSMSYQRKVFYDGINFWSFFFDGANTIHKYSVDDGQTWTYSGPVFTTPGVNETSIWYDSSTSTVYAVGDTSSPTNNVSIQVGTVDAPAHTISWAAKDSSLNTSRVALAGKNTYICKDSDGYLWVLSSNCTLAAPAAYQLSAFKSFKINSTTLWVFSGQMLTVTSAMDNVKGSIVPAGSGSDVWAIYAYAGNAAGRKYTGIWLAPAVIYSQAGSRANTDNSPPSVVVDGSGVVHVVYGTGRRNGPTSTPTIEYSHNNTGMTTFTLGVSLDPSIALGTGDYYPTISLETSTGDLNVFWIQGDAATPKTIMGRKCVSGTWSDMTIEPQTSFTKRYLTSIYSVSGEFKIYWQWTQNVTTPIDVLIDHQEIPEFGDLTLPIIGFIVIFAIHRQRSRSKEDLLD